MVTKSAHVVESLSFFILFLLFIARDVSAAKPQLSTSRKCTEPDTSVLRHRSDGTDLPTTYKALLSCPNVTELIVSMTMTGCVSTRDPWAFNIRPGDRLPPLKRLTTSRYKFDHQWKLSRQLDDWRIALPDAVQKFFSGQMAKFDGEKNLEMWLRAMDWTQLEYLGIDQNKYFFDRMHDELPGLRSLSAKVDSYDPHFRHFLAAVPSLESLSIVNRNSTPSTNNTHGCSYLPAELFLRHGPTLKNLSLHQPESFWPGARRTVCTPAEIEQIYAMAPILTHIGLDLDRNGAWPNETLDALMQHDSLNSLHLYLEIGANLHLGPCAPYKLNPDGVDCSKQYREPLVSKDVVRSLFEDLRAKKKGIPLRRLEVDLGDWVNEAYMGPLYIQDWSEGRDRKYVCEAVDVTSAITCDEVTHDYPYD